MSIRVVDFSPTQNAQGSSFLATLGFGSESLWDTVDEIRRLLAGAGLVVRELRSSHDGQKYQMGNPLLLIIGEKARR